MSRQMLAEKVIDLLKDHAYPFGGYLRDFIAGDDFTDLDMFFPACVESNYIHLGQLALIRLCQTAGLKAIRISKKDVYNKDTGFRVHKDTLKISDADGNSINVDCVRSANFMPALDNPFMALDADVNALWLNKKTGKVETAPGKGYDLNRVISHIACKVFEVPPEAAVSEERLNKLFKKGYKPVDAENTKPDSVRKEEKMDKAYAPSQTQLSFGNQFKSDLEKAAYRSCGTQMTSAVKQGILTALKTYGAEEGVIAFFAKTLDTDAGTAGVSAMLGHALPHAPVVGVDPRIARLSEEFRVAGYAQGMNLLMAALMQFILPGVMTALQSLPPVSENEMAELDQINNAKLRVGAEVPVPDLVIEQEHLAEQESAPKRAQKRA